MAIRLTICGLLFVALGVTTGADAGNRRGLPKVFVAERRPGEPPVMLSTIEPGQRPMLYAKLSRGGVGQSILSVWPTQEGGEFSHYRATGPTITGKLRPRPNLNVPGRHQPFLLELDDYPDRRVLRIAYNLSHAPVGSLPRLYAADLIVLHNGTFMAGVAEIFNQGTANRSRKSLRHLVETESSFLTPGSALSFGEKTVTVWSAFPLVEWLDIPMGDLNLAFLGSVDYANP
jgi:hypothetical protein